MAESNETPRPPPRTRIRPRRRSSVALATAAAAISICGTSCAAANENQHIPSKERNGTREKHGDKPTAYPVLPNPDNRILDTDSQDDGDDGPMPQSYIIGGTDLSNPAAHPWFAATKFTQDNIHNYGTEHTAYGSNPHQSHDSKSPTNQNLHALQSWLGCGASLIASRFVVTAAHCVWDPMQDPYAVASGKETRRAMDPLEVGLEYRVGFSGYCPDQLVSRNNNNAAGSNEKKDAIMEAAAAAAASESRLHVDEPDGSDGSTSSYGSAAPPPSSMEENCGQPYEDIPAVDIHLHPAHPDTGSVIDLAIVELAYPSNIAPVALDTTGSVLSTIDQGARMTVLGAGKTHGRYTYSPSQWNAALPDELQSVEVGRVPVQHCVDQLPGLLDSGHLDGSMICSVSLNRLDKSEELGTACHGDSGGPLIVSRPKEGSSSTTTSTTNLRQHPTPSTASSNTTAATATSSSNQDILLGVVSVGKQNCNGEATAYTSASYASGWMCSIMCQDSLGLVAFEDCPDWCYDEENGRYHGEVTSDGNGGSAIFGFTGDSEDGNGGTAYGPKEQQGRAHAFIDGDEGDSEITPTNGNSIDCETEGNLEFLFRSKSKSCRWLGKANRSLQRILRICSKTNARDVCAGTCRAGSERCVFSS